MRKGFVKLKLVIAICLVLGLLECINVSIPGTEKDGSEMHSAALAAATSSFQSAGDKPWRFVVFGDTRDSAKDTQTGISPLLCLLAESIAAEKPALVTNKRLKAAYLERIAPFKPQNGPEQEKGLTLQRSTQSSHLHRC